jgi:hypothetical protein
MNIDLTGIPGFKADGPPSKDWVQPLPILKAMAAFTVYTLAIAGLCVAVWMVAG